MAGLELGGAWNLDDMDDELLPDYGSGSGGLAAVAPASRSPFLRAAQQLAEPALAGLTPEALAARTAADKSALEKARGALTREKTVWDNPLLRMGLEMMSAGATPGATFLGSVGKGGKAGLDFREQQKAQDELRQLKLAEIERQIASLPYQTAMQQLELAGKLGAVKAPSPYMSAGRGVIFDTEKGQYVEPPAGMPGLGGNRRIFGSAQTGYFEYDPNTQGLRPVVGPVDPSQDPRVLARLREQYIKMADNYGWKSLDEKNAWVDAQVDTASRGMRAPGPVEVGASVKTPDAKLPGVVTATNEPPPQPIRTPVQEAGAKKESEEDAKLAVKEWGELREQAGAASNIRGQVAQIRGIDADTDRLAPLKEAVGGWAAALPFVNQDLGVIKDAQDLQKMNSVLEEMVLQKQIQQKGVQTEGDAKRMKLTLTSLTNTKEANDYILRAMDAQAATQQLRRRLSQLHFDRGMTRRQALDQWDKMIDKSGSFLIKKVQGQDLFLNEFLDKLLASKPEYQAMPEDEFLERALLTWQGIK